jgi:hypothetical protein
MKDVSDAFAGIDVSINGFLSKEDLRKAGFLEQDNSNTQWFDKADFDNNGEIDWHEWIGATSGYFLQKEKDGNGITDITTGLVLEKAYRAGCEEMFRKEILDGANNSNDRLEKLKGSSWNENFPSDSDAIQVKRSSFIDAFKKYMKVDDKEILRRTLDLGNDSTVQSKKDFQKIIDQPVKLKKVFTQVEKLLLGIKEKDCNENLILDLEELSALHATFT